MPPKVRAVQMRLNGDEEDVQAVLDLIAMLPALSQDRVQLGKVSPPYPNHRGSGARSYVDLFVVDEFERPSPADAVRRVGETLGRFADAMPRPQP